MYLSNLVKYFIAILGFAVLGSQSPVLAAETTDSAVVELQPQNFKPAFTRDTVIKLNAIVRRSLNTINTYDSVIKNIRTQVEQASDSEATPQLKQHASHQVAELMQLQQHAEHALADMRAAVKQLKASGEYYNKTLLAGMIDFVEDVEREISAQRQYLARKLAAS